MKLESHEILKAIVKAREISLAELDPLIDKKFNDYRDYYPLAMLCTDGYVKCDWTSKGEPTTDEYALSSIYYASVSGNDTSTKPENNKFFTSPKAELYFAEAKAKHSDRIYSMAVGIVVGICTAILAVKLGLK